MSGRDDLALIVLFRVVLNETIRIAAGEDIDLGFRLREIGALSYASTAAVSHDFADGLWAFMRRFVRYGNGNKLVERLHRLDLAPRGFRAKEPSLFRELLAKLRYRRWRLASGTNPPVC